jgi:hypothetical protein
MWLVLASIWVALRLYAHFVPLRHWKSRNGKHAAGVNRAAWDRIIVEGHLKAKDGGRVALALLGVNVWARWSWPWRKYNA